MHVSQTCYDKTKGNGMGPYRQQQINSNLAEDRTDFDILFLNCAHPVLRDLLHVFGGATAPITYWVRQ